MDEVRLSNVGHEVLNLVMFRIRVEIGHHDLGVDLAMAWTKAVMIATLRGDCASKVRHQPQSPYSSRTVARCLPAM